MKDIGPIPAKSIYDWFRNKKNMALVDKLLKHVLIEKYHSKKRGKLKGKRFVLTGVLDSMSRSEAEQRIITLGGEVSGSVSKNIEYVVIGKEPGSKYDKAKKLGVRIINEKEFLKIIK